MFVLHDIMNDDIEYFKWHTASTNVPVAQVLLSIRIAHVSVVTQYDYFVHCLHCDVQQQHITSNAE